VLAIGSVFGASAQNMNTTLPSDSAAVVTGLVSSLDRLSSMVISQAVCGEDPASYAASTFSMSVGRCVLRYLHLWAVFS